MQIIFKNKPDIKTLIAVPLFDNTELPEFLPANLINFIENRIKAKQFNFDPGSTLTFHNDEEKISEHYFVYSLGKPEKFTSKTARNHFAKIIKAIRPIANGNISLYIPDRALDFAQSVGEAIELGNYFVEKYKTGKSKQELESKTLTKSILFGNIDKPTQKLLERGLIIGESVNTVRDLVNGPSNIVNINYLTNLAKTIAKDNKYKITILDKEKMTKLKMGALLGVNQGSKDGAKLVILEHHGGKKKQETVAIVGKGIVFDTGGVNLKPSQYLDGMHTDMSGAAVVIGIFKLLGELNIKQNVIGAFPLTDNAISSTSQLPNDIVTSYSGKTIEIGNTDAEGRLVLADTISYLIKHHNPDQIIDIATLTGACRVALGEEFAGLFGNNKTLKSKLRQSAQATDESIWPLPLHPNHKKMMKSNIADINNINNSGLAGASTGAAFISEFVENKPWAHLDIAGTASVKVHKDYEFPGATGYGVRLLLNFLENS